jgi:hypothetical protein
MNLVFIGKEGDRQKTRFSNFVLIIFTTSKDLLPSYDVTVG